MTNDMNAFELNDEQLAEVAGGALVNVQLNLTNQITNVVAPTTGIVIGIGGSAGLLQLGSQVHAGNGSGQGNGLSLLKKK